MRIKGSSWIYAAKRFYDIGDPASKHAISYKDNLVHLKEEVIRQSWAKCAAEKFQSECIKKGISIHSELITLRGCSGVSIW